MREARSASRALSVPVLDDRSTAKSTEATENDRLLQHRRDSRHLASPRVGSVNTISLHFDASSFPHAFEHDLDGLNYFYLWVCLAVHNYFMFGFFALSYVHVMLLCEPVVPT